MFKVNNKDTRTTPIANGLVLASLFLTSNTFHTYSIVSIVKFEQVNAGWVD